MVHPNPQGPPRQDAPPRQWAEVQVDAARKLLRFFLPTLAIAGLLASVLCAYPEFYPARFGVSASVVVATIPAWMSLRRGRPMRGLVLMLSALSLVLITGTVMNGGALAPAYTALFIVLAAGVWFMPRLGVVVFVLGFLGLGMLSGHLMDAGIVPEKSIPNRTWYAGILTVVAVVVAVTLIKIRTLLHEALESSAKSYKLLASVVGAIDDRLILYNPSSDTFRVSIDDRETSSSPDFDIDTLLTLPVGNAASEPDDVRALLRSALTSGAAQRRRVPVGRLNGTTGYLEVTAVRVEAPGDAKNTEIAMLVRDITDDELQRQHWNRSQKLEAIGSLASGIAHDFNNVLTGIRTSAELLAEEEASPDTRSLLSVIIDSSDRAALLTKRLLLHGQAEKSAPRTMDLAETVRETMALIRATLLPGITLELESTDQALTMVGDSSAVQGMILNLALNAAHAVGQRGRIRLRLGAIPAGAEELVRSHQLDAAHPHAFIEVEDNGCGIPEEIRASIFDAFVTTRPTGEGTGLGLWTTRNTVHEHHGEITLTTAIGLGTTFRILLPLRRPVAVSNTAATSHSNASTARIQASVMIIDDEPMIRNSLQLALSRKGYRATAFETGQQALAMLAHTTTDVLVLDMMMPEMTGYEIFQRVQALESPPKVILSTGFANNQEVTAMEAQGLFATLIKPYPIEDLVTQIEAALERRDPRGAHADAVTEDDRSLADAFRAAAEGNVKHLDFSAESRQRQARTAKLPRRH